MRVPVELRRSPRLINHGPSTVIAEGTFTRELVDASGEFVVCLPTLAMLDTTYSVGDCSGREVDIFVAEIVAARADDEVLVDGEWRFTRDEHRTLHHLSRGVFFTPGQRVEAGRRS